MRVAGNCTVSVSANAIVTCRLTPSLQWDLPASRFMTGARIRHRYASARPSSSTIELDISDSGRKGLVHRAASAVPGLWLTPGVQEFSTAVAVQHTSTTYCGACNCTSPSPAVQRLPSNIPPPTSAGACRYTSASPAFSTIELDISDSGREGCAVSTLTVMAEPPRWREATEVAVQEMRRLQRFGLTAGALRFGAH